MPTHRKQPHLNLEVMSLTCTSTALQTVLLAILILIVMGFICSLTTKSLHKIVLWFAPINGTCSSMVEVIASDTS